MTCRRMYRRSPFIYGRVKRRLLQLRVRNMFHILAFHLSLFPLRLLSCLLEMALSFALLNTISLTF